MTFAVLGIAALELSRARCTGAVYLHFQGAWIDSRRRILTLSADKTLRLRASVA